MKGYYKTPYVIAVVLSISVFIAILIFKFSPKPFMANPTKVFRSQRMPFSIQYPSGVTINALDDESTYNNPNYLESVNISSTTPTGGIGSDKYGYGLGYIVVESRGLSSTWPEKRDEILYNWKQNPYNNKTKTPIVKDPIMINAMVAHEIDYPVETGYYSGFTIEYFIYQPGVIYRLGIVAVDPKQQEVAKQIFNTLQINSR